MEDEPQIRRFLRATLTILRVYMGNLRHKLEVHPARPRYLLTKPGVGYRLAAE